MTLPAGVGRIGIRSSSVGSTAIALVVPPPPSPACSSSAMLGLGETEGGHRNRSVGSPPPAGPP